MCLQCVSAAETILEDALPGYALMISTREADHWPKGAYGLVRKDNPDFIWEGTPLINPWRDMTDKEINALSKEDPRTKAFEDYADRVDRIEPFFRVDPIFGHEFFEACIADGYDPDIHGRRITFWFVDHVARKLPR